MKRPAKKAQRAPGKRLLMVESAQESLAPSGEPGSDMQLLRRLVPFARPHAWLFVGALVTMPLAALAALVQPLMVKGAIEATLVSRSADALMMVVFAFAAAITVESVSYTHLTLPTKRIV